MIRIYKLTTETQEYVGMEVDRHADIVRKHKTYKFNPALSAELSKGFALHIIKEFKSLTTAEQYLNFYAKHQDPRS